MEVISQGLLITPTSKKRSFRISISTMESTEPLHKAITDFFENELLFTERTDPEWFSRYYGANADSVYKSMWGLGIRPIVTGNGDIIDLHTTYVLLAEQLDRFIAVISPYVDEGSELVINTKQGYFVKYSFENGKVNRETSVMVFPSDVNVNFSTTTVVTYTP